MIVRKRVDDMQMLCHWFDNIVHPQTLNILPSHMHTTFWLMPMVTMQKRTILPSHMYTTGWMIPVVW